MPFELRVTIPGETLARIRGLGPGRFRVDGSRPCGRSRDGSPRSRPDMPVLMDVAGARLPGHAARGLVPSRLPELAADVLREAPRSPSWPAGARSSAWPATFAPRPRPSGAQVEVFAEPELAWRGSRASVEAGRALRPTPDRALRAPHLAAADEDGPEVDLQMDRRRRLGAVSRTILFVRAFDVALDQPPLKPWHDALAGEFRAKDLHRRDDAAGLPA